MEWMSVAACTDTDPDVFFPEGLETTRDVRWICKSCPVREQCLEFALSSGIEHGVWGGLAQTELQRRKRQNAGNDYGVEHRLLSIDDAAARARVSRRTIERWIRHGLSVTWDGYKRFVFEDELLMAKREHIQAKREHTWSATHQPLAS
ncbi:WhiB family transcriptional regulator [Leifsonia sp. 22587]|uniref:WhiB family transcriptional regulator n=1 Tax=Leifsonia sp. 22587 TaxID=3453946 RepID=UPI003F8774E4